jgi:mevalonate kinase
VNASAPGKIILFGEHAVVYGRPALAVPVTQVHADVDVAESARPGIWIDAPNVNLRAEWLSLPSDHPIASVLHNFFFAFGVSPFPSLDISITSTIPVASGLGSGAAVTVALVRALSSSLHRPLSDEQVNAFAYEIEKLHHGTPSGIDNTVITYARPVYFIKGQPIETFTVGDPFTIVIGDTGISAPTKESVGDVRKLWEADKAKWEKVFDQAGQISKAAREQISKRGSQQESRSARGQISKRASQQESRLAEERIEDGWMETLGALMNRNHALLQEMTVSSPELDRLVDAALRSGARGAKLSGGGRGGNMIALVEKENAPAVAEALLSAGAKRTIITTIA